MRGASRRIMPQRARRVDASRGARVESRAMTAYERVFDAFHTHRLVSVIRASDPAAALGAARAVIRGGIRLVEITYSVPDAPSVMEQLVKESAADVVVGAGTVLTSAEAGAALD